MTVQYLVEPANVEKRLHQIWDNLKKESKLRASLFNLIIYTKQNDRIDYFRNVMQKVIEKFPCRIIFITDQGGSNKYIKTAVSVLSPKEESLVACDTIDIALGGDAYEMATLFLLPHLLTDLPIYLMWAENPSKENSFFESLKKLSNKIIFDSEVVENMSDFAKRILQLKQFEVADLNWARTENWRHLLASYFNSEEKIKSLAAARRLSFTYNAKMTPFFCHTKIKALYLQAWLASCLNWELLQIKKGKGKILFSYKSEEGRLEIELLPTSLLNFNTGDVTALKIETAQDEHYLFERNLANPRQITIEKKTSHLSEKPHCAMLEKGVYESSLVKEIFHRRSSPHFLQTIDLILKSQLHIC